MSDTTTPSPDASSAPLAQIRTQPGLAGLRNDRTRPGSRSRAGNCRHGHQTATSTPRVEGPVLVIHQSDAQLDKMDAWNKGTHGKSGLIDKVRA